MTLSWMTQAMAVAGCSSGQIAAVVLAYETDPPEGKRSAAAIRQAKYRSRKADKDATNDVDVTLDHNETVTSVTKVPPQVSSPPASQVSPKDNNQTPFLPSFRPTILPPSKLADERKILVKAEEFYQAYPKKVDPKDAKAKFVRTVKGGVGADRIIAAAKRYAAAHVLAGTDKQFIPAPAVWLNKGSFDNEDLPAAVRVSRRSDDPIYTNCI